MADKLFIDTWGWLTLHDKGERYHQQVTQAYQQAIAQNGEIYTTDYVLDETFTFFFRRLPAPRAEKSMKGLLSAFLANNFHLIRINEVRFTQTLSAFLANNFHLIRINEVRFTQTEKLRSKFLDKPLISFTDLTSMVVMQELGIMAILTEDAHFTHVGMGFQLLP